MRPEKTPRKQQISRPEGALSRDLGRYTPTGYAAYPTGYVLFRVKHAVIALCGMRCLVQGEPLRVVFVAAVATALMRLMAD